LHIKACGLFEKNYNNIVTPPFIMFCQLQWLVKAEIGLNATRSNNNLSHIQCATSCCA